MHMLGLFGVLVVEVRLKHLQAGLTAVKNHSVDRAMDWYDINSWESPLV